MSATGGHFHERPHNQETVDVEVEQSSVRRIRRRGDRHLITDAQRSPEQNRRSRETQYLILQLMRIPFIALSLLATFWWHNWWLGAIFFIVSIPLPWISVMVANGQGEVREKRERNVYKPAVARQEQQLEAARQAQLGASSGRTGAAGAPSIIDHDDHL